MGSLQADSEEKQEMDDSGCIQDETSSKGDERPQQVYLLDLSDDVLLLIMMNLSPRDLKALGFSCERLGALVLDRTLWVTADARLQPLTHARLRWYLDHALHAGTKELLVSGYAREANQWLSQAQKARQEKERAAAKARQQNGSEHNNNGAPHSSDEASQSCSPPRPVATRERPEMYKWPPPDDSYPGPQLTMTPCLLRQLTTVCPNLTSLALDYCNINCNTTGISQFPPTLRKMSLRGSRCYNHPLDRSFLFKIQDYLPNLETLDVCECDWMEPASLLPLSKLPNLRQLYMRDCYRLTEFVAYASLATRYGFIKLQTLDLRGSPVGDSEVSALGWLMALHYLWLSPARASAPQDAYQQQEPLPDLWEEQEPEYYKNKPPRDFSKDDDSLNDLDDTNGECDDSDEENNESEDKTEDNSLKRKSSPNDEPGPSKRKRDDKSDKGDKSDKSDKSDKGDKKDKGDKGVNNGASTSKNEPQPDTEEDREGVPRHHVLYVNVGQQEPISQVHAVYRLSLDTDHIFCRNPSLRRTDPNQVFLSPAPHLDATSLVTDSAVRRFGRADGEDINYVHLGPDGPYDSPSILGARPNRSNITHLSITGFRYITDRSLMHLATAAPHLVFIDFSETNVTPQGVETFKSLRPECEVIFSPYVERKE